MSLYVIHLFGIFSATLVLSQVKNIVVTGRVLESLEKEKADGEFHMIVDEGLGEKDELEGEHGLEADELGGDEADEEQYGVDGCPCQHSITDGLVGVNLGLIGQGGVIPHQGKP